MAQQVNKRTLGPSGLTVGPIGFGAMMMTWCDPKEVLDDERAFKAIKTAINSGCTFINTGVFYGNQPDATTNLQLLRRYFDAHPEDVDKVVVSIKGGARNNDVMKGGISASIDNLREDMERIQKNFGTKKKVDIYEVARVDPKQTIEETIENLVTLQKEGHFKYIGLSEIHPTAFRRAIKAAPGLIAAVEIELSLFSREPEGLEVLKIAEEEGIAVVAYSPLGRGLLTGRIRSIDDFPADDFRRHSPYFQGDNFNVNLEIVDKLHEIAKEKGVTAGQLALAYLLQLSDVIIPIPGSGNAARVDENAKAASVTLTHAEKQSIEDVLGKFKFKGDRYPGGGHGLNWGKGKE